MFSYLLRRILLALPTLLVISLITFGLSKCAPGDAVRKIYGENLSKSLDPEAQAAAYGENAAKLGLDKPVFYFSLTTAVFPDTLYRIFPPERQKRLRALTAESGNWPLVTRYEAQLAASIRMMERLPDSMAQKANARFVLSNFFSVYESEQLPSALSQLAGLADSFRHSAPPFARQLDSLRTLAGVLSIPAATSWFPTPAFYWYGMDNQYHHWLTGFLTGHLDVSYDSRNPVGEDLYWYVFPTLLLNGLALLLAYLVAVPLGVNLARRRQEPFDIWTRRGLLFLYALPVFWMGSLLVFGFATPGYGLHLIDGISPEPWKGSQKTFFEWSTSNASKFVLPVLTLAIHALAVLAMQMRGGMLDVIGQDFIRTARAKGVPEEQVFWRHAFRNALFPIITVFASVFPAVFAGSLVVEYLFNFPGMGIKTQEAFIIRDYPVLFAIMMFAAVLTILGSLIADLLFAWADPRVRFSGRKN